MSFIAGYITGLSDSGNDDIYGQVLTLPVLASFQVTDNFYFDMRYDTAGIFINTPNITTSGCTVQGEQIAYVQREYLSRPVLWLCLRRGTQDILADYISYITADGWGHMRYYDYDSTYGLYLQHEDEISGSPSLTFAYLPDQTYNIGSLNMQWIFRWIYDRTVYDPDGSISGVTEMSGGIVSIPSVPYVFNSLISRLTPSEALMYLHEFAAECEAKRQELIHI